MDLAECDEVATVSVGGDREDETVEGSPSKNSNKAISYLTPKARLAFIKTPILQHFDLECYIRIETNASCYAIDRVLSQLTLDNLGRWHSIAFYLQKMILAKTEYETHNGKLLAIVEAFKTW